MRKFEVVKRLEGDETILLPQRSTVGSAGYDLYAIEDCVIPSLIAKITDPIALNMGITKSLPPTIIKLGIKAQMEDGEVLKIYNRSSNAIKKNLILANGVGIIDKDYYGNPDNDGEIMVAFYNLGASDYVVKKGDKIAQAIFEKFLFTDDDNAVGERLSGIGSTGR